MTISGLEDYPLLCEFCFKLLLQMWESLGKLWLSICSAGVIRKSVLNGQIGAEHASSQDSVTEIMRAGERWMPSMWKTSQNCHFSENQGQSASGERRAGCCDKCAGHNFTSIYDFLGSSGRSSQSLLAGHAINCLLSA